MITIEREHVEAFLALHDNARSKLLGEMTLPERIDFMLMLVDAIRESPLDLPPESEIKFSVEPCPNCGANGEAPCTRPNGKSHWTRTTMDRWHYKRKAAT